VAILEPSKRKGILFARALRYQAEIHRLYNPPALGVANSLLTAALDELAPYAPLEDRDLLDQAEINELQGCIRFGLNFNNAARVSLSTTNASLTDLKKKSDTERSMRYVDFDTSSGEISKRTLDRRPRRG